jgi:hypothetical protein
MKWAIVEDKDIRQSLYKKYCERLKMFEEDGQELFIELSYRFEQILFVDYIETFLMSFLNIDEDILRTKEKIIISPLINPFIENRDNKKKLEREKTKSAQFLYYLLSNQDLSWIEYSHKFEFCDTIVDIKKSINQNEDTLLILIDDFIGSGGTAINYGKAIFDEINRKKKYLKISDFCIVSIAAMEAGIKYVKEELGIFCYSNIIRKKGISDFYPKQQADVKKEIMRNLELMIYLPKECPEDKSLGHAGSEALITFMNKTPNNTFPVFWYETNTLIAPFPRYKNFK